MPEREIAASAIASENPAVSRRAFVGGFLATAVLPTGVLPASVAHGQAAGATSIAGVPVSRFEQLVRAYPDHLKAIEGGALLWRDGTRMPLHDGKPRKSFEQMLRDASIADQLRQVYKRGKMTGHPPVDFSPGRIRNEDFFAKMYGDCRRGSIRDKMKTVVWMPRTRPQRLRVTTVNNVAGRLEQVIADLERLPDRFKAFLVPSAGTFVCRVVKDTGKPSMHASGAAIDINVKKSDYWLWARRRGKPIPYRNRIPWEIAEIFEARNFIWGGKWYHYDTMHFEYRPEMFG